MCSIYLNTIPLSINYLTLSDPILRGTFDREPVIFAQCYIKLRSSIPGSMGKYGTLMIISIGVVCHAGKLKVNNAGQKGRMR